MTQLDITHVARLANLTISEKRKAALEKELEETLKHVERLSEIDTAKVTETNEVTNLKNVMREDEILPSLSQEEALINAKKTHNGFFVVPVILEEAVE